MTMHPTAAAPSVTLGTYTKSLHAAPKAAPRLDPAKAEKKAAAGAGRYRLMRTAQSLLWDKGAAGWKEQHRTCWCSRSLKREAGTVGVYANADGSGASLTGLNRCGEIWTCPTCAAKIAEERRAELSRGMAAHLGAGGGAYLLTLTFPHERDQNLFVMLEKLAKARQRWQNGRDYKRIMKDAGRLGSVVSLELTISKENGWHPHLHILVFAAAGGLGEGDPVNAAGDLESEAIAELRRAWINHAIKCGLATHDAINDMQMHAFNVRGGTQAAEYIAKYGRDERHGASAEMTASYGKRGTIERAGLTHWTPFQLLELAGAGDDWAACRFRDYAKALAGKRAITWSPQLKKSLGVTDRTDEEIAADDATRPEQIEVGALAQDAYQDILRRDRLPDFLLYVANSARQQSDLDDYVAAIRAAYPPTRSGAVIQRGAFAGRQMVH